MMLTTFCTTQSVAVLSLQHIRIKLLKRKMLELVYKSHIYKYLTYSISQALELIFRNHSLDGGSEYLNLLKYFLIHSSDVWSELQSLHRASPLSSHFVHLRAKNSSVNAFDLDRLLPWQLWQGVYRKPPQPEHVMSPSTF